MVKHLWEQQPEWGNNLLKICFFKTKPTLTGSTEATVERGEDSSPSHRGGCCSSQAFPRHHGQELWAGPHPKEPATVKLLPEKQTGPGDLQTSFKMISNPTALLLVLLVEKKSVGHKEMTLGQPSILLSRPLLTGMCSTLWFDMVLWLHRTHRSA